MWTRLTLSGIDQYFESPCELGILYSPKQNRPRYPAEDWIWKLTTPKEKLSLHFCGDYARNLRGILEKKELLDRFGRIQLNLSPDYLLSDLKYLVDNVQNEVIIQSRNFRTEDLFEHERVSYLVDYSGGAGKLLDFEKIPERYWEYKLGFAGGLNSDNLLSFRDQIDRHYSGDYWLDLESGIRDLDDRLSFEKIEKVTKLWLNR